MLKKCKLYTEIFSVNDNDYVCTDNVLHVYKGRGMYENISHLLVSPVKSLHIFLKFLKLLLF